MLRLPQLPRHLDLRELADDDLMALIPAEDARAFEIILDRHSDAAFSLAYRMCGRRGMAEDVVQEAFLSVWRRGARYDRARGSVRTWVLGIVRNRAIDFLRAGVIRESRNLGDEGLTERLEAPDRTEVEVARRDEARHVRGVLGELPIDQRYVIELAYFGGFTQNEIAEMLAVPLGTVKGRMRLGLTKMHIALGDPADAIA